MISNDLNFAMALFDIAKEENKVQKYYDEILVVSEIIEDNPEFLKCLKSFSLSLEEKEKILDKTFLNNGVNEMIVNLMKLLVKKHKIHLFLDIIKKFEKMVLEDLGLLKGIVYSVVELSKEQMRKIENFTAKKVNRQVILKNIIDSNLIAGIKIVIGSYIFENSITSQLEQIKKHIIKGEN